MKRHTSRYPSGLLSIATTVLCIFVASPLYAQQTTAPTAPSNLTATAASSSRINLSWTASTGSSRIRRYYIERCQGAGCSTYTQVATSTGTSYGNNGLQQMTSYSYRVRALDRNGNYSTYSNIATAVTFDGTAPTAPSGLTAAAASAGRIDLAWTASTDNVGVTGYQVERCQGAGCSSFSPVTTVSGSVTAYSNTNLSAGTSYSYRVRATDSAGNLSGYSNTASATTPQAVDTSPPTDPSNLAATAGGNTSINLAWTASADNIGVTGYQIERCQGTGCGAFTLVTSVSVTAYNDTGLTAGTSYSYRVRATDAAGNLSGYSNTATTTTAQSSDTTAPTAPSNLAATASGTNGINLSWTASTDNVAVTGYQVERCQGTGCSSFALLATIGNTASYGDTNLSAGTSYGYRVRATDAAGNLSGYSNTATATTQQQTGQPGLVAAYGYSEGSGTTTVDASGNSNTGTISGATWTGSGRYGSALSFNGTSNRVNISDANSLDLTAGMTIEAWVYPGTVSGWRTVMLKEIANGLAYALYASDDKTHPAVYINTGGADLYAAGTTALPANAWSHLAATYDGTMLRLYVNGAPAGSRPTTGSMQVSTGALRVGGNAVWGEYYQGRIDEVRIYNRALAQTEIQTDMSTPVVALPADTTAPSAPSNLSAIAAGSSTINLSWTASTDDTAVTGYLVERCQGAGCSTFSQIATTTTTTFGNSGLPASTSYSYRVRATDAANNLSSYSATATAVTGTVSDTEPPTAPVNLTATAAGSSAINLAWSAATDNTAVTGYLIERCQGAGCSTFSQIATATSTTFSNIGLTASASYSYRVRATDGAGNIGPYSGTASATTQSAGVEPSGWYTGDMHVHRSCGGAPEAISSMYNRMSTQNIAVLSLLADMGNGEVQDPALDLPRVNGSDDPVSTANRLVHWDAEWHWDAIYTQYPHQALGGHVIALGLNEAHQIWEEYTYPIFQWAHQQNAVAGFAHMQYLDNAIPQTLSCCTPIEYPVEAALGSVDFITEDVNGSDSAIQAYYRLLNTGFRPGFTAGTDYPCNGGDNPGALLTYVKPANGTFTYRNWIDGIAQGRTVVSRNGHHEFLDLAVNGGAGPGDEIKLTGSGTATVTVVWTANQNLNGTIELVKNGTVVASKQTSVATGAPATLTASVEFTQSGWVAARRMDPTKGHITQTGAVFVLVNNAPVRASVTDAEFFVQWMDNLLTKTAPGGTWSSYFTTSRDAARTRYQAAKAVFQQIALEAANPPAALNITTPALPDGVLTIPYGATLTASGGSTPYTWSIANGSLPPGVTLNGSLGTIAGTPAAAGSYPVTVRVTDGAGTSATKALSVTVSLSATFTVWPITALPANEAISDGQPITVGFKFRSDVNGFATGLRFYKGAANTGTHTGSLWTAAGTLLATATFASETASGWQEVSFSSPVAITANQTYVASYYSASGYFALNENYFTAAVDSPPLHALADGTDGGNGVYFYGNGFPTQTWNGNNYWVDVVFSTAAQPAPVLTSMTVTPVSPTIMPGGTQQFTATGAYSDGSTDNLTGQAAWASSNMSVATIASSGLATAVGPGSTTVSAARDGVSGGTTLTVQATALSIATQSLPNGATGVPYYGELTASGGTPPYTWSLTAGSLPAGLTFASSTGVISGTPAAAAASGFTVRAADSGSPVQTATRNLTITVAAETAGPILIITSTTNPFTSYLAEILRAEGMNEFTERDLASVTASTLAAYDVVLLGNSTLTSSQVTMLTDWVNGGGHLIAMRPDKKLTGLLGLTDLSATLANAYLKIDTASGPGEGLVNQTIQFHGTADRFGLNGASAIATLYSGVSTSNGSPAVSLRNVGANGGTAAAFAFDLARSVIYTRQGNPAWSGQERDGDSYNLIRSDDLFFGDASFDPQPDWINLDKVAIPQADEQQRLLANLIIRMNEDRKPLPRFWYLPRGLAAAVVMTGDDHDGVGTAGRFDMQYDMSPAGCNLDNWECIRSTSYIFPSNTLTNSQASAYNAQGFEIGVHVTSNCTNWTASTLEGYFTSQLGSWSSKYSSLPSPVSNRMHCIAWSDYATMPATELRHGIRFDTNYYYWPPTWINDRPGFFTGSGMPMRFADLQGNLIDVYQATTQLTDESGQSYPYTIDTLLDRALGPEGYYGVFTANAHNDVAETVESDAIVNSARARGVPVVTARQMLLWLDGRNSSRFSGLAWDGTTLQFSVVAGAGANGLTALVPVPPGMTVSGVARNGSAVTYAVKTLKGIAYAQFSAVSGVYRTTFNRDTTPPAVASVSPPGGATGVNIAVNATATFSEDMDPATITTTNVELRDGQNLLVASTVQYDAATKTATLDPAGNLAPGTFYTVRLRGGATGVADLSGNTLAADYTWSFTTASSSQTTYTLWPSSATPASAAVSDGTAITLGVKFRSDVSGYITGIRFYKGAANTGTHTGSLWTAAGGLLATATFTNESASGWQQAVFANPVPIAASQTYIASYYSASGYFALTPGYFTSAVDAPPLHALADGTDGGNGVYAYGNGFPTQSWNRNNYWVDVLFQP